MARRKEYMTVHTTKVYGLMVIGAVIGLGLIAYGLSFVFVPTFSVSLGLLMAPMGVIGLAAVALLIKEMK